MSPPDDAAWDDPVVYERTADEEADALEKLFAELPKVIPRQKRTSRVNRALIYFILGSFLTFGLAFQHAAAQDRRDQTATCRAVNDNARRFNELIDTLIQRARQSTVATPEQKAEAVRLYSAVKQTLPPCDPPEEPR